MLGLADANSGLIMADVGAPGRHSDVGVFAHSELGKRFIAGNMGIPNPEKVVEGGPDLPFVMVGDEAFALSSYLMKPYARRKNLNLKERVFNYRLSRARRIIECTFVITSAVWRIFRAPLRTKLPTTLKIIKAVICLHNFIMKVDPQRKKIFNLSSTPEAYDNCFIDLPVPDREDNYTGAALHRENFAKFFMTEGAVDFQWQKAIDADF